MTRAALTYALVLLVALFATGLRAEDGLAGGEDKEPVFTQPKLVEYVAAEYPAEAFAKGIEAAVTALLDVDESGLVTGVAVTVSAGPEFDAAASAAMLRFVFEPATRDGVPIPSRVLYRYTFFLQEKADAAEADTGPPEGAPSDAGAEPDTDTAAGAGAAPQEDAKYFDDFGGESGSYETTVRGRRPPREVTRREITRREITRIPGTGGDALRAVQNMPGMARPTLVTGDLIVRGSSPGDSAYFFDSMPVPLLYHFGGLTSVVNSDLLERIDFYPGNYGVRYGGATGGIVDVYPRAPYTDRWHAYLDADFWDIGALVEGPINEDWSVAASVRRSYIDAILNAALPDDGGLSLTTAPRYWDYQVVADFHPSSRDNLNFFVYGSDDKLVFILGEDVAFNPNFSGGVDVHLQFHRMQMRWRRIIGKGLTNVAAVGVGYELNEGALGQNIEFLEETVPVHLRDELAWDPGRFAVVRTGIDGSLGDSRWRFRAPEVYPEEGSEWDLPGADTRWVEDEGEAFFLDPAWFGEVDLTAIPRLRLIPGLRVQYFGDAGEAGVDPRFTARFQATDTTVLKGGVGLVHQAPGGAESNESYGNPDLHLVDAVHYGLGVEQELPWQMEVGLEGFYKDISNLVVSSDRMVERDGALVPELYSNEGVGQVYGLELLLKRRATERLFGWISYTLMRSSRIDHPGEASRLFDYDQTHILTIVVSAVLGRGWEAGLRFRLTSGNPETPVMGSLYDGSSDVYLPIYGAPNSTRLPLFHQLDLRIDKIIEMKYAKVSAYLDIQNVYNQRNVEGYDYNYDYTKRQYFYGLPIIPSLGLKIEY